MPELLTCSGTSLMFAAVPTGAAVWQVSVKRRERRKATHEAKDEEEGAADARVNGWL